MNQHSGVNLIPGDRRAAQRQRRRLRTWIVAGIGWTGVMIAACAGTQLMWGDNNATATASELTQTQQHISDATQKLNTLRRQLSEAQVNRQTAVSLSDQPDWSILLNLLSSALDDEVMLREIQVAPEVRGQRSEVRLSAAGNGYTVSLRGFARSQPAVSQFVLRLQQNGLFDDVKLLRTGREPVANTQAVSFDIACEIKDAGGRK